MRWMGLDKEDIMSMREMRFKELYIDGYHASQSNENIISDESSAKCGLVTFDCRVSLKVEQKQWCCRSQFFSRVRLRL